MAFSIQKRPYNNHSIIGQDLIWSIKETSWNSGAFFKFKYICYLYTGNTGTANQLAATLKFSPNSNGVGVINVSDILRNYVGSDNLGNNLLSTNSTFKGVAFTIDATPHPIHLIDRFCLSQNACINWYVIFKYEYSTTPYGQPNSYGNLTPGLHLKAFNGVDYGLEQLQFSGQYGVFLSNWNKKKYIRYAAAVSADINFLSNAPTTQYVGDNDYHTLSFLNGYWGLYPLQISNIIIKQYDSSNTLLNTYTIANTQAHGGAPLTAGSLTNTGKELLYFGVGPANLKVFTALFANWSYYTVEVKNPSNQNIFKVLTFNREEIDCKGFEKIRLTWLNKFGTWDYYNFTKRNTRETQIKKAEYTKIRGNYNTNNTTAATSGNFTKFDFNRGRNVLKNTAFNSIKCNSDWFRSDEEASWIEELFISNEVYILNGYDSTDGGGNGAEYGKYLIPVVVSSKKYEKYTAANDKLAQYEIEIEYASNMNTHLGG